MMQSKGPGGRGVGGEIEDLRVDGEVLGASAGLDVGDGDGGDVEGADGQSALCQPEGVAAEAGGDVEGAAGGGEVVGVLEEEGVGVLGVIAGSQGFAVAVVPGGGVGHGGRVGEGVGAARVRSTRSWVRRTRSAAEAMRG